MMNRSCFALLLALAACGGSVTSESQPGSTTRPPGDTTEEAPMAPGVPGPTPPPTSGCDLKARTYATGEGGTSALAVDDRYVYWLTTDAGASAEGKTLLRAADKCGLAAPVTLATAPYFAGGLSVDAKGVYFTTTRGDGVGSVALLPKEVASGVAPWAFGKLVSWDGQFQPGDVKAGSPGAIMWVEPEKGVVAGIGKASTRTELVAGLDHPTHLAFDGQFMYVGTASGLLRLDSSPPTKVAPGAVVGLTSDPVTGVVFALTRDTAYRIERGQKPSVLLASFPAEIDDIAANSIELYFIHGPVASLGAFPVGGGPSSPPMTTGGKGPGRIAADDGGVYYAAGGVIARVTSVH